MAAQQANIPNLTTILKRLEAVTSRLEDLPLNQSHDSQSSRQPGAGHDGHSRQGPGSAAVGNGSSGGGSGSAGVDTSSPVLAAYKEIIDGPLADYVSKSKDLGGLPAQHAALLPPLLHAQLDFLSVATQHTKPTAQNLPNLLQPQAQAIQAIIEAKDKLGRTKEGREWGAALSVISEGVSAWGWVQVEPAPVPFIGEMKNASQFWADRVTKQFKETKPEATAWAKSFIVVIEALQEYVKKYHTTGVSWNAKGSPAPSSIPSSSSPSAAGAPPPPPPPPPVGASSPGPSAAKSPMAGGGQAALLAELNKGGSVTSGLKKVDASQMTHKNPELRSSSVVPDSTSKKPEVKPKPGVLAQKRPAKTELEDGNKWVVEYHEDNRNIVIDQTELSHVVHIFGCNKSTIRINGKINAITMVACKKTAIVLDSLVSSLSITSSPGFEVQINGSIPTVQIDNTDSGSVYLSKECVEKNTEIITSKTSSINVQVPKEGEEGDYEEKPVPEQMKSVVKGGKLITEIIEHKG